MLDLQIPCATFTMPTYKLTYFNSRGNAEVIRMIMAYGDIEYEDVRLTGEQWLELKPSTYTFVYSKL